MIKKRDAFIGCGIYRLQGPFSSDITTFPLHYSTKPILYLSNFQFRFVSKSKMKAREMKEQYNFGNLERKKGL